ncbi:MAG: hypothetical protein IKC04_02700 [Oscillospiraceae bacterium]|nr:hypothetical protein [Oscillospiraceae bacterium]
MRRSFAAVFAAALLLLTGCSAEQDAMQKTLDFRQNLLSAGGCSFVADVTADYGEYLYAFTLQCVYRDGYGELTVLKPDEISGIRGRCSGDAATVSFDGAILEYGDLSGGNLAPLSVPWLFGSAWQSDEILFASKDEKAVRATIQKGYDDEKLIVDTWFDDGVPTVGEVSGADGRRALTVQFRDFSFETDS